DGAPPGRAGGVGIAAVGEREGDVVRVVPQIVLSSESVNSSENRRQATGDRQVGRAGAAGFQRPFSTVTALARPLAVRAQAARTRTSCRPSSVQHARSLVPCRPARCATLSQYTVSPTSLAAIAILWTKSPELSADRASS